MYIKRLIAMLNIFAAVVVVVVVGAAAFVLFVLLVYSARYASTIQSLFFVGRPGSFQVIVFSFVGLCFPMAIRLYDMFSYGLLYIHTYT